MAEERATCNYCGASVDPSRDAPCWNCGLNPGKGISAVIADGVQVTDSVRSEQERTFWEINWPWLVLVGVISVVSPFVGLVIAGTPGVIVGLIIALVEFVVGVYAIGRVREITRGGDW